MRQYCELVRCFYAMIASSSFGYASNISGCLLRVVDGVKANSALLSVVRQPLACTTANLFTGERSCQ